MAKSESNGIKLLFYKWLISKCKPNDMLFMYLSCNDTTKDVLALAATEGTRGEISVLQIQGRCRFI